MKDTISPIAMAILFAAQPAFAAQQESITIEPSTGDYLIWYVGDDDALKKVTWIPATKISPLVRSRFREYGDGLFRYTYEIRNGVASRQNVADAAIQVSSLNDGETAPPKWKSANGAAQGSPALTNVGWWEGSPDPAAGIKPGEGLAGFLLDSGDLPGVGVMRLSGGTPRQGFPDEGPDAASEVARQFTALNQHNYVVRYAAVPLIPVPSPFSEAAVLGKLRDHIRTELVSMGLIDSTLAARLDNTLQAAISAAQTGNTEALRRNLRELRRAINNETGQEQKEQAGESEDRGERHELGPNQPLARLAREVLEFDFRYLEKRKKWTPVTIISH